MKPIIKLLSICSDNIENRNIEMASVARLSSEENRRALLVFHALWKVYKMNFSIPSINAAIKIIRLENGNEFPDDEEQDYESLIDWINTSLHDIVFKDAIQKLYK